MKVYIIFIQAEEIRWKPPGQVSIWRVNSEAIGNILIVQGLALERKDCSNG